MITAARAFGALGAVALVVSGCGGSRAATAEKRADCERAAEAQGAFTVARNAFDAGKLDSPNTVARFFKGRPTSAYLDANGRLRDWSYFASHVGARFDVDAWMAHLEGSGATIGQRMYAARMKIRSAHSAKC